MTTSSTNTIDDEITSNNVADTSKPKILEPQYIIPFILVASLFPLWGFANDITNPLVEHLKTFL